MRPWGSGLTMLQLACIPGSWHGILPASPSCPSVQICPENAPDQELHATDPRVPQDPHPIPAPASACAGIMCATTRRFVVPSQPAVWGALLAGGFLGYLYQLALTAGLQRARAAPAVAMSYLRCTPCAPSLRDLAWPGQAAALWWTHSRRADGRIAAALRVTPHWPAGHLSCCCAAPFFSLQRASYVAARQARSRTAEQPLSRLLHVGGQPRFALLLTCSPRSWLPPCAA